MISDVDWLLLERRLESIESSIDMLKAMFPVPQAPTPSRPADLTKAVRPYGALGEIPCVFDNMPESEKMKPLCISCPCPKCSPYALSSGSLSDAGTVQVWNNNHKLADCISTTKLEE
ncbi:hypothetical protein [Pseudomonas phage vB_PsaM_M1]|nr:hypothetical protein [Pseudomonas phage vB_PsaM_M1]